MKSITPEQIDDLLPQTQCGLCGYGGCMPYAEAIVFENAAINLCPPGGVKTLQALGQVTQKDVTPYLGEMEKKFKPPTLAIVREAECIGCTKCIQACPVDAIIGSAKQMHVVIAADCTGCELCIPACPVDCIDLLPVAPPLSDEEQRNNAQHARQQFQNRSRRLAQEEREKPPAAVASLMTKRKSYIEDAIARVKAKKR